jgi:hypothetical protein
MKHSFMISIESMLAGYPAAELPRSRENVSSGQPWPSGDVGDISVLPSISAVMSQAIGSFVPTPEVATNSKVRPSVGALGKNPSECCDLSG